MARRSGVNTWTHIAATYDGSNLRFYVNATLTNTLALPGSINVTSGVLFTWG